MRKVALVNTFGKKYWPLPEQKCLKSIEKYWPKYVETYIYPDDITQQLSLERQYYFDLVKEQPVLQKFIDRHGNDPKLNPRIKQNQQQQKDFDKDSKIYVYDAVRFSYKVFACIDAYQKTKDKCQQLWLLDSDLITFEYVPQEWTEHICPEWAFTSYLGRPKKGFSETGIYIFNTGHKYAEEFFTRWQEYYDKDKLFNLKGYTDSFVFDAVRLEMEAEGKIKNNDLNDGRWSGKRKARHPFINSELGKYMDHLKGYHRKSQMKSHRRDLTTKHTHPYWNSFN